VWRFSSDNILGFDGVGFGQIPRLVPGLVKPAPGPRIRLRMKLSAPHFGHGDELPRIGIIRVDFYRHRGTNG